MKYYEHPSYIGCAGEFPDDERQPEWEKQYHDQGFDVTATWNLDSSIRAFIYPRLLELASIRDEVLDLGGPGNDEYHKDMLAMLNGFEKVDYDSTEEIQAAFDALARQWIRLGW